MRGKNCHLCQGDLFARPLLELKGMPKAAQYYPDQSEFSQDKAITLKIYQCADCGLVQHDSRPVDYYKEVITVATLSERSRNSRLSQAKEIVQKYGLRGRKIIDIGSGRGEMLDVLAEAGLVPTGIEASAGSVEFGRAAGRKMIQGYIGDINQINGGKFDAFISLNYLEHLPEPGKIIRNIHQITAEDAVGYVTVPNLGYLLRTRCFYEFVADHLSYFTQNTLIYAFEANGFEVLECKLINNDNDIAVTVRKKTPLNISRQYEEVEALIKDMREIIAGYKVRNESVVVWGAGHRTLALLALGKMSDIDYIVDSAKIKQGKFMPILHKPIVSPERLKEDTAGLVMVMVPGIYPDEVVKVLKGMNLRADIAKLSDNKIVFIKKNKEGLRNGKN